jgi:predicted RNase H-like nuclease
MHPAKPEDSRPSRLVGVDLAWGPNGLTGLAVLDRRRSLLDVRSVRTDDEILDWVRAWAPGPCVVAFDAPLVVRNPSGRRGCETLVGRWFARYDASCHSSNTANRHFADGGRAMRLSRSLGLATDPWSRAERRAIEVYPHPAIVSLFDLDRILRYKDKPGRELDFRRGELLRLLDLVEGLGHADVAMSVAGSSDWRRIRGEVVAARRKVDLGRVEDSVDAVVCAYVGALADAAPERVRVLGTAEAGAIVVPVTAQMGRAIDAAG